MISMEKRLEAGKGIEDLMPEMPKETSLENLALWWDNRQQQQQQQQQQKQQQQQQQQKQQQLEFFSDGVRRDGFVDSWIYVRKELFWGNVSTVTTTRDCWSSDITPMDLSKFLTLHEAGEI